METWQAILGTGVLGVVSVLAGMVVLKRLRARDRENVDVPEIVLKGDEVEK